MIKRIFKKFFNAKKAATANAKSLNYTASPHVSFYDTVESSVFARCGSDTHSIALSAFRALPYDKQHSLAFSPRNGEFTSRALFWASILQPILPQKAYHAAMIQILNWYRHCKGLVNSSMGF